MTDIGHSSGIAGAELAPPPFTGRPGSKPMHPGEKRLMLEITLDMIDRCLGSTTRDTNRAYYLAAQMLGVDFKDACRLFKLARIYGAEEAVRREPELVREGAVPHGFVYFASADGGALIKIGFSAAPEMRLPAVERMTGKRLTERARRSGFPLHELAWHVRARPAWLGGEWYDAALLLRIPAFDFLGPLAALEGKSNGR